MNVSHYTLTTAYCLVQLDIQYIHSSILQLQLLDARCQNNKTLLLLLGHLAQQVHLEHVEIAAIQLDYTLTTIDAQQVSSEFTILASYHFHLHNIMCDCI